jgi:hypothetical protein
MSFTSLHVHSTRASEDRVAVRPLSSAGVGKKQMEDKADLPSNTRATVKRPVAT